VNGKLKSKTVNESKPFNSQNRPSNENINHIRPDIIDNNNKISHHNQI